ncbi:MAG: hypothetical protein HYW07_03780 [Candidatus Latescibacteria bacterium]|nr:hypothetical protein [Candidatus Latescibacterota bacterium]
MTEASTPQPARPQPPEELHWGISYLREDIQDLRQEMRGLDAKLEARTTTLYSEIKGLDLRLNAKIEDLDLRLNAKIEDLGTHLNTRIDGLGTHLNTKIDGLDARLNTRIDQVYTKLDAEIDTKFYWTLGTILLTWASTILTVLFK